MNWPTNQNSNAVREIEALEQLYAAINRNEISATLPFFDPAIERIEPPGFPTAGIYRGHQELLEHMSKGRGTWAEGSCDPERFLVNGDKIVVFLHVRVRLKDKQEWIDARFADGFVFRNGKAIQFRSFAQRREALDWAGMEHTDAS